MKQLPTSLEKQTILDAISEVIFDNEEDIEVLFSKTYNILDEKGWGFEKMPIMNLSPEIRRNDKTFLIAPHYKFTKDNINIFIGPSVFAFSLSGLESYTGWKDYKNNLSEAIKDLEKVFFHLNIKQISMKYIDFFKELNIFENLEIQINDDFYSDLYGECEDSKQYTKKFEYNNLHIQTTIDNGISLNFQNSNEVVKGSIVDINIGKANIKVSEIMNEFDSIHKEIKNIFFNLLKDDFIESMIPTY